MRVYLAGGMRERPREQFDDVLCEMVHVPHVTFEWLRGRQAVAWADIIQHLLPAGHDVFDPRSTNTKVFEDYSFLDVTQLWRWELLIAYLELENPSGVGLATEVAYFKGLGKPVLLINEKQDRYSRFVENFADRVLYRLQDAVPITSRI